MDQLANGLIILKVKKDLVKIYSKEISLVSVLFLFSDPVYLFKTLIRYFFNVHHRVSSRTYGNIIYLNNEVETISVLSNFIESMNFIILMLANYLPDLSTTLLLSWNNFTKISTWKTNIVKTKKQVLGKYERKGVVNIQHALWCLSYKNRGISEKHRLQVSNRGRHK